MLLEIRDRYRLLLDQDLLQTDLMLFLNLISRSEHLLSLTFQILVRDHSLFNNLTCITLITSHIGAKSDFFGLSRDGGFSWVVGLLGASF